MLDREEVRRALARHPARSLSESGLRPAAVLIPLFSKEGEDHLLLTLRTEHLPHHRGEVSFPGGVRHSEDPDLLATALRETEEEMGIARADVDVLGRLDEFESVHGFRVVPYVGAIPFPYPFRVNRGEIAEVLEVPLRTLLDPAVYREEDWSHRGRSYPVCFYAVGPREIWGLTGAILSQFLDRAGLQSQADRDPRILHR